MASPHKQPLPPRVVQGRVLVLGCVLELIAAAGLAYSGAPRLFVILVPLLVSGALLLFLIYGLSQISPVYRAIGRTPPSPAALRDLHRFPRTLSLFVLLVHGFSALWLSATERSTATSMGALLVLSVGGVGSAVLPSLVRKPLLHWLSFFEARALTTGLRLRSSTWLTWTFSSIVVTASASAGVAAVATGWTQLAALSDRGLPLTQLAILMPLLTGGVGAVLAYAVGRRLDRSLQRLTRVLNEGPPQRWPVVEALVRPVDRLDEALRNRSAQVLESASREDSATQSIREVQLQKMLFMASTGHDLRSPLNSILGFSELLISEPEKLTGAQQESIRAIIRSGEELLQLLKDILESARIAAGRLTLDRDWVPAVEILTDAVEQGHRAIDRSRLRIEAELQPGLPPVFVDRGRVLQAIGGLLRHAGRSMNSGVIELKARVLRGQYGPELRVDVVDGSERLRPEDRERIFEAFHEISLPPGKRLGGLGLALSLAKSLIVAHGGDVSASNTPGVGTTFTLHIPLEGPERA